MIYILINIMLASLQSPHYTSLYYSIVILALFQNQVILSTDSVQKAVLDVVSPQGIEIFYIEAITYRDLILTTIVVCCS